MEYYSALTELETAEARGVGAYEMCVAHELRAAIKERVGVMRIKKAREMVVSATGDLYRIAMDVFNGSAGACSPRDAAFGAVKCFVSCGMDLKKTEAYAKSKMFALMC